MNQLRIVIGLLFFVTLLLQNCGETEAADQEAPPATYKTVATQKVKAINYQPVITASGKLAMDESINLSFKTGGQIKQLFVKNGQTVKKGQVLAILNTNQVEIQADQASIDIDRIDIAIM